MMCAWEFLKMLALVILIPFLLFVLAPFALAWVVGEIAMAWATGAGL